MQWITSLSFDLYGRPIVNVMYKGKFGTIEQQALVDTGASTSLICTKQSPIIRNTNIDHIRTLQSYNGKASIVPFIKDVNCQLGSLQITATIGLQELDNVGILGMDLIKNYGLVIDLPNRCLYKTSEEEEVGTIILPSHRIGSVKACQDIAMPTWESDVQEIVERHLRVFAQHKLSCGKIQQIVSVTGPDPRPIRQYKFPVEAQKGIDDTIQALLTQGIIVKCESPCNSPIWPVKKADGKSWRLTVDYRELNKVTPKMTPVVAKYPEIIAQIANGARWFSVIDISNAFFSIPLHPDSWYKFAFTYLHQQFTFTRVPQGFHNAPTICHRAVTNLWKNCKYAKHILSYVDDILIATVDREEHLKVLGEVLDTLEKAGFLINSSKAQLVKTSVTYLGVELGKDGRKPDQERIKMIASLPAPTDVHTLRMFLGLLGFSRDFIENFGLKAKPLYKLLKKSQPWQWGTVQQEAFMQLKQSLMQAPALAYPDPNKEFHLQLSTGKEAIGAILMQEKGTSTKPVAYGSRTLSEVEQQYTACEKEVLALVWAIQHWEYLVGMAPIVLKTCHTPVRYIISGRANNGRVSHPRIAQWTLALMSHPIRVEPSKTQNIAPALLCRPVDPTVLEDHECPMPEYRAPEEVSPFSLMEKYEAIKEHTPEGMWVVDGSCLRTNGKLSAGAAALHVKTNKEVLRSIDVTSAQAAEIVAIILALENSDPNTDMTICTDSEWVLRALIDWMIVWRERGMNTTNNKPVAHAVLLNHAWNLARQRSGKTYLFKVKAHRKNQAEISEINNIVDQLAKKAAALPWKQTWKVPTLPEINSIEPKEDQGTMDLIKLQTLDREIGTLMKQGKYKNYNIFKHACGVIMARKQHEDTLDLEKEVPVVVMPTALRQELISLSHAQGHFGVEKTLDRLSAVAWWPQIQLDVEHFIQNCLRCAQNNPKGNNGGKPIRHQPINGPWHRLQIDFIGPLPKTARGNSYCLVIVDPFTKWVEAIPTKNCTAKTTARVLLNEVFARFGLPSEIDSDQGTHFTGEVTQHLCAALGIRQRLHIPGHPQSSGLVERSNRTIKTALRKIIDSSGKRWDEHLPLILMAIRSTVSANGYSPHEALLGRPMKTPELWWVQGGVPPDEFRPRMLTDQYIRQLLETISSIQKTVAITLKKNMQKVDRRLAEHLQIKEWEIGDQVLYRYVSEKQHPLSPRWMGPCFIINKAGPTVYQLEVSLRKRKYKKWFHSSQLKPWKLKDVNPQVSISPEGNQVPKNPP